MEPKTITIKIDKNNLAFGGGGSGSGGFVVNEALKLVKNKVVLAIGATAASVLIWGGVTAGLTAAALHFSGNDGIRVTVDLGVKTVTRVRQGGTTYTYDEYYIEDVDVSIY